MSFVGDFVSDIFGGGQAEEAAQDAAQISADAQREALAYLKEREAIPEQFRESALQRLGGIYGLPGGVGGGMEETIERAKLSPYYRDRIREGEESIMRTAGATGRLRSGTVPAAVSRFSSQVLGDAVDRELLGLTEMSRLPSNVRAIAQQTGNIGQTLAQGQIAGSQAQQSALGTGINALTGLGGLLML